MIDEVDDFQMSWEKILQHFRGPTLQSLWEDGVVGVGARGLGDLPGLKRK